MNKEQILQEEFEKFVNSDSFEQMIKEKLEYSHYYKYQGVAPEGFVLIPLVTLEKLKNFELWKEWKYDSEVLSKLIKEDIKNFNL